MKNLFITLSLISIVGLMSCGKNDCQEKIIEDCVVTYELAPVCGCNGKTYNNPSEASCSGIEDYTDGACQ